MISNSNNLENNQIKKTDLFTLLKTVYPSEELKFKKLSWMKEKKNVYKDKINKYQLFTDEKIQFNQKEKTLLKSLLLTEIPQNLRKKVKKKKKSKLKIIVMVNFKWSKKRYNK